MRTLLCTALIAALCFTAACGGAKKSVKTPEPEMPAVQSEEVATGELREALLQLRKVYFSLDSDTLSTESRNALAEAGTRLTRAEGVELYVEGHTDKRGTGEYNLALGERRGQAVAEYLVNLGVPKERLHVISRGAENPVAEGSSQADYAQNRRVEFRLMRGSVRIVLEAGTPVDDQGNPIAGGAATK